MQIAQQAGQRTYDSYANPIRNALNTIASKTRSQEGEWFPEAVYKKPQEEQRGIWKDYFSELAMGATSAPMHAKSGVNQAIKLLKKPTISLPEARRVKQLYKATEGGANTFDALKKHEELFKLAEDLKIPTKVNKLQRPNVDIINDILRLPRDTKAVQEVRNIPKIDLNSKSTSRYIKDTRGKFAGSTTQPKGVVK